MNKSMFKGNVNARVKIRPLVYYADLNKYLDEDWIITAIYDQYFCIHNPNNGFNVNVGFDLTRSWNNDFDQAIDIPRGKIILNAQVVLSGNQSSVEPLTDSALTHALDRRADSRLS